jgi:biopolymer transport protein ExbB
MIDRSWRGAARLAVASFMALVPLALAAPAFAQDTAPEETEVASAAALVPDQALALTTEQRTLADWWRMGGWIMWPILGVSILALAIVLERLWSLRRGAVIPRSFMRKLVEHWRRRDVKEAVRLCAQSEVSIARVLRAGLIHADEGAARMEDAVTTAGEHEAAVLRKNLPLLATLANLATMLGLLGTVLGMIQSFDLIAKTGTGDARVVAGGIFVALITTAAGLMVGVPVLGVHSYLRRKVDLLEIDLEETSMRLLEALNGGASAPKPSEQV